MLLLKGRKKHAYIWSEMVPYPVKGMVSKTGEVYAEVKNQMEERNMSVISMKQLLEAGVHFGHQTRRWNLRWLHTFTQREKWYLHHRLTEICR